MNLRRSLLLLFAALPFSRATAQLVTPIAPIVLELPAGPRSLAMGDVGVTSRDDEVLFFNPAQLAVASGFSSSVERFSSVATLTAFSAVTRFNGGGIGVGMRFVNYNVPQINDPTFGGVTLGGISSVLESGNLPVNSLEATAGIAQVFKGWRVGAAAKWAQDGAFIHPVGQPLVDIGVARQVFNAYTVGASVQNLGPDYDERVAPTGLGFSVAQAEVPRRATLGVSRGGSVGEFDWFGTAAVSWVRQNTLVPAGGLEMNYSWLNGYNIALRAGARRPLPGEEALTAGAGFTMDRLSIDYALETLSGGRIGNRIGLRVR
jgi:hypothetical protein